MDNLFSVIQYFSSGGYERVLEFVEAEKAVKTCHSLCNSVGAKVGTTVRVIIIDSDDIINFEWKYGEGIVFPKKEVTAIV